MPAAFLAHPSSLEHETGMHPERAERLIAIERELDRQDWLGYQRLSSPAVDRAVLEAVHPAGHIEAIEALCRRGGGAIDLDTVAGPQSFHAALHAAGGAVRMVELLLDGEADCAFSAHRPPGHHASAERAMGFCLFNNIAVAAQHALDARGLDRVMVLDWDVHHGNGTNDIFSASDRVLFVSIHQWPLYPGSGRAEDCGRGRGEGSSVNLPVPAGSGDETFGSLVGCVALPLARAFSPQLILVSAGFDAHSEDPLGGCAMSDAGYGALASMVRAVGDELGAPVGCVLEGGYAPAALARSTAATMRALSHPDPGVEPSDSREASSARARLARWWPGL